jgi:hypothetical protein
VTTIQGEVTMPQGYSSSSAASGKPAKPYHEIAFLDYFGWWDDPAGALDYKREKDNLHAGRLLPPDTNALTLKELANNFLNGRHALLDAGELSPPTWLEYKRICDLMGLASAKDSLSPNSIPKTSAPYRTV